MGRVIDPLNPAGRIEVHGEIWRAETDFGSIALDTAVKVLGREGLLLHVTPEHGEDD